MKTLVRIMDSDFTECSVKSYLLRAIAEEYQAWYQYHVVIPFMFGPERASVAEFFKEAARDELDDHAQSLVARYSQLSDSIFELNSPDSWAKVAPGSYLVPLAYDVQSLLAQNIKSEENAITLYTEIWEYTKDYDPVTSRLVRRILSDEEEHLDSLNSFVKDLTF